MLDVLFIAGICAAAAIAAGYGGRFHVLSLSISATSVRNPTTIALTSLIARTFLCDIPLFGIDAFSLGALPVRALRWWEHKHKLLQDLTLDRAGRAVAMVMAGSLAVKLVNAYWHFGFWTGDDVEIHEMTFAWLFAWRWEAWNLRSPFYPATFIYPVQALLVHTGLTDPRWLIFAGRAVVAAFSIANLCLTFYVARRLFSSLPIAVLSVLILAANKLHTIAGSTELPRTVSSFFILAAFTLLIESKHRHSAPLAGALVGIGAGLRFSEAVFVIPATFQLAIRQQWRQAGLFSMSFALVILMVFGAIDRLYWGTPFYSLTHAVDYTLVRGLSSRGYQPFYYYITSIPAWADLLTFGLALAATRSHLLLASWTWLPMLLLSLLPHKEPRYLVPMLPFFAMLAASSLWTIIEWLSAPTLQGASKRGRREQTAITLLAACGAAFVLEVTDFWFVRSEKEVAIAQYVASQPVTGGIVAEQAWKLGRRLYLKNLEPVIDVDPAQIDDRGFVESSVRDPAVAWVAFQERDLLRLGYDSLLREAGFRPVPLPAAAQGSEYRLFRR